MIYRQKWCAPRSRRTVCASLRSQNAHGHVTRIILREFTAKRPHPKIAMHSLCEPAQSKRTSTCHKSHFVREFQRKFPPPKGCDAQDCAGLRPALSKRTWTCHRGNFMREFAGKVPRPKIATHSMCERAQSNCRWASLKSHSMREFTGNMPPQKLGAGFVREGYLARAIHSHSMRKFTGMPRPRSHSMQEFIIGKRCAPEVRSRHAHGHLRTAILCENLQGKNWGGGAPGLNFYRKNPSVWTHCLGKKACESVCLPLLDFHNSTRTAKPEHWKSQKTTFYAALSHFFVEVYKVLRLPRKMSPMHSKSRLPHGIIVVSQIKFDSVTNRDFRPLQNVIQPHQKLRPLRKIASKSTSDCDSRLPTF